MNNYEQAKEEFLMFQNALDNAKKTEMEVGWFSGFVNFFIAHSRWEILNDNLDKVVLEKSIQSANKKLGM